MNVVEHDFELGFTLFKSAIKFSHEDQPRPQRILLLQDEGEDCCGDEVS